MFGIPLGLFLILTVISLAAPASFLRVASQLNDLILQLFSHGFAYAAFGFVLTCIWAAVSPLGRIRIGGAEAVPIISRWNWMAISLTTTPAIGILFWASAEPIYHLAAPS